VHLIDDLNREDIQSIEEIHKLAGLIMDMYGALEDGDKVVIHDIYEDFHQRYNQFLNFDRLQEVQRMNVLVVSYLDGEEEKTAFALCLETTNSSKSDTVKIAWFEHDEKHGTYLLSSDMEQVGWDALEMHNVSIKFAVNGGYVEYLPSKHYVSTEQYVVEELVIICDGMLDDTLGLEQNPFGIEWKQPQKRVRMAVQ
jgi:hypothetical protein